MMKKTAHRKGGLGVTSPSPWPSHPSLNENILFGFQAEVVMREVYINFIFSHNFLLRISILVFCCLLFQRHLYANTSYANYFHVFPLGYASYHPPGRIISHENFQIWFWKLLKNLSRAISQCRRQYTPEVPIIQRKWTGITFGFSCYQNHLEDSQVHKAFNIVTLKCWKNN